MRRNLTSSRDASLPHVNAGASAGFGLHLAWRFAELGSALVLVARRLARLQALAAALQKTYPGTRVHVVGLDVRDIPACERIVDDLPDEFKQVKRKCSCEAWWPGRPGAAAAAPRLTPLACKRC